ncbi:MAG: SBBP repeat-containing protein [Candidatus Hodarchaeota archaeon]
MTLKAQSDQYSPLNRFITEKRHIPTHIILLVILSTLILFLSPAPLYSGLFQPFSPHLTVNEIPSSLVFGSDLRDAEVSKPPVTHSGTGATTALPFSGFIQNLGQVSDNTIEYYYSSNGLSVGFCASRISFVSKVSEDQQPIQFAFTFPGSDSVSPVGRNKNSHYTNYFYGDLQLTNVPSWQELWYYDLYSGIDLRYYMSDQGLKYDFVVHPEADPTQINLRVSESMVLAIGEQTVTIQSKDQPGCIQFQDTTLQVWQTDGTSISSHFVPKDANLNTYGFRVDHFDPTQSLIIDPLLLSFSTYLGGNGYDVGVDIAVDAAGNSYITGQTTSHNFPLMNPNQNTFGGTGDVFVTKLNATGSGLVFSTYLGGSGEDGASGIAVDSAGDSYITGRTYSTDFPVTSNAYQNTYRGGYGDGFVTKLNATGNGLVFSTYLGGSDYEKGRGIAVDITGNTYITGLTYSSDFPVQHAYQNTFGGYQDAFVTKLNGTGTGLAFSTYLGGSDNEYGYDIAVDAAGNSYITGSTDSDDFPVTSNAYQSAKNGGDDAFVTKLSSKGNKLSFSTYLGGSSSDEASGITVDADGNICITGHTYSMDFPVTANAYQSTYREWGDILDWRRGRW